MIENEHPKPDETCWADESGTFGSGQWGKPCAEQATGYYDYQRGGCVQRVYYCAKHKSDAQQDGRICTDLPSKSNVGGRHDAR